MLQPSPVERVSAIDSDGAPSRPATALAHLASEPAELVEVRAAGATLLELLGLNDPHRVDDAARQRPERSRVQVREPLEHGSSARTAARFTATSSPLRPERGRRAGSRRVFYGRPARARALE